MALYGSVTLPPVYTHNDTMNVQHLSLVILPTFYRNISLLRIGRAIPIIYRYLHPSHICIHTTFVFFFILEYYQRSRYREHNDSYKMMQADKINEPGCTIFIIFQKHA